MQVLAAPKDQLLRLAFSPDGRYLAGGGGRAFHLWDLTAGSKPLWSLSKNDLAVKFCFAPSGAALMGGSYGSFAWYDVRTGKSVRDDLLCDFDPSLFSPDGQFGVAVVSNRDHGRLQLKCAVVGFGGCAEAWRKDILYNRVHEPSGYRTLLFSTDGARFVRVVGQSGRNKQNMTLTLVEVFDAAGGELVAEWIGELPYYASEGAVSPAGVVALLNGRALHVINATVPNSEPVKHVNASPKPLEMAAFSRDGARLVTVGRDATVTMWNTSKSEIVRQYEWKIGSLKSVCFAPDGLRCAAGSETGRVVVWDLD